MTRHRFRTLLATGNDLGALAELEACGFPHPWSPSMLAEELDAPASLVFKGLGAAGKIVAYAVILLAGPESELLRITVAPEHRRRGGARHLLESCFEHLRRIGVETCRLEVRSDNRPAQELYRGLGFRRTGRRPAYYPDRCDALLYRLDLSAGDS